MQIIFSLFLGLISFSLHAFDWRMMSLQNGCSILGPGPQLKVYPGEMCIFLDNGTFVSGGSQSLRRFNRDQSVMWEIKGYFHHQINLSSDKKRILALASETVLRGIKKERDDLLIILDVETGKIIHQRNGRQIVTNGISTPLRWPTGPSMAATNSETETGHFNSIYEITENQGEKKAKYLKPGNIIVNSLGLGTFILSPDLKETLYHKMNPDSWNHQIHDVQVTPNGEFILFNNMVNDPTVTFRYSAINKFDPVTNKTTFWYNPEAKAFFFSTCCGGVQELDNEHIFFSPVLGGSYLYSRKQKKILFVSQGRNGNIHDTGPSQQVKMLDLRLFLENSRLNASN